MSSSPLTLSVILVTYNSRDFLPACLDSLKRSLEAAPHGANEKLDRAPHAASICAQESA